MKCLDNIVEKSMSREDLVTALTDDMSDILDSFITEKDEEQAKKELLEEEGIKNEG